MFLPSSQDEAGEDVVGSATEGQPTEIVKEKEEMEQISEAVQGEKEENTVEILTPWEKELEMLED
jgi:hypothetical protein